LRGARYEIHIFRKEGERWIPIFMGMTKDSNEITTLSSKARNDRGIKANNIYLQMGKMWKKYGKIPS